VNVQITALDHATPTAPAAKIIAPTNGQTASGSGADFYGYGYPVAPATLTKAEFFVDGVLKYTDPYDPTVGHFHYNGAHAQWDTTQLSNGSHTLKMTVFDSNNLSGSDVVTVTVNNGSSTGGGGGGGSGVGGGATPAAVGSAPSAWGKCGATGLEAWPLLALLARRRRRRRA